LGRGEDGIAQVAYYDEGVGTGVFDSVTGGGFGFGLDANVREAYNWLIREYREGDEIYIYGFSRGAYTARSLVGFISTCGLLRCGAPLAVSQLWEGYSLLGWARERKGGSFWDFLTGKKNPPFRRISSLAADWFGKNPEETEEKIEETLKSQPMNETEQLLVQYSRRVPIQFLGIFDTVGAMGWEALAIPGLRSKLSIMHNMYVTGIIQNCSHALAINENRSSFKHTPMHQWISSNWDEATGAKAVEKWRKRITQRWFAGAHSNIGGGYPNNTLSVEVLRWMMDCSRAEGLAFRDQPVIEVKARAETRRDSYAEFAAPFWMHVVRAKRWHRRISPPVDVKANTVLENKEAKVEPNGYARKFIDEGVHESVLTLAEEDPDYAPLNLVEYARRQKQQNNDSFSRLADRPLQSDWLEAHRYRVEKTEGKTFLDESTLSRSALIVWSSLGAAGFVALAGLINGYGNVEPSILFMALLALLLVLIDWVENKMTMASALEPENGFVRAWADSVYWARAVGVLFFFAGLAVSGWNAFASGIGLDGYDVPKAAWGLMKDWWPLPVAAYLGILYADWRDGKWKPGKFWKPIVVAVPSICAIGLMLGLAGAWSGRMFPPLEELARDNASSNGLSKEVRLQGLLLFLQIALLFLAKGFLWVGEPMRRVRLGSITGLQKALTPKQVVKILTEWRDRLICKWEGDKAEENAAERMQASVREALHRDMIGFIPLYTIVFSLGLWMVGFVFEWDWLETNVAGCPVWVWIIVITALADYVEDWFHFRFLNHFAADKPISSVEVAVSFCFVAIKVVGVLASCLATVVVCLSLSWQVVTAHSTLDWRGKIAGTVAIGFAVLALIAALLWAVNYFPGVVKKKIRDWRAKQAGKAVE
jgi:hypothetical protein